MAIDLSALKRGIVPRPPRIAIYGEEKIGKSTFAAGAPNPIFFDAEPGQDFLNVVTLFTDRTTGERKDPTFKGFIEGIEALLTQAHEFGTLVVDSTDWLEHIISKEVAKEKGSLNIEDAKNNDLNFGKGWKLVADRMKLLFEGFDALRVQKNMAIILICHAQVHTIDNDPIDEKHQHATLKLNKNVEAVTKEWVDVIGFARQKVYVQEKDLSPAGKKNLKTVGRAIDDPNGPRLFLKKSPAYTGGSRVRMPDEIPLDFNVFLQEYEKGIAALSAPAPQAITATT